jgi:hypothetical protein
MVCVLGQGQGEDGGGGVGTTAARGRAPPSAAWRAQELGDAARRRPSCSSWWRRTHLNTFSDAQGKGRSELWSGKGVGAVEGGP